MAEIVCPECGYRVNIVRTGPHSAKPEHHYPDFQRLCREGPFRYITGTGCSKLDATYLAFEDQFRGSREEIKKRLAVYLPVLRGAQAGTERAPVLDVGCGNGTQTVFLAEHYSRVLGLEVSESAVQSAKQTYPGVEFRQYDLLDEEATKALHSELGDCNIYVRAVLHPLPDESRAIAVANLARLLGKRGGLFVIELAKAAKDVFGAALAAGPDSVPKLRRVLSYGITPANLEDGMLEQLFENAGIEVVDHGSSLLLSTDRLADGEQLKAPLNYVVGRLKHS